MEGTIPFGVALPSRKLGEGVVPSWACSPRETLASPTVRDWVMQELADSEGGVFGFVVRFYVDGGGYTRKAGLQGVLEPVAYLMGQLH